jgi:acetyl-CoA/propionyl-CoA carboxylase carboxyl transferase subunit
MSALAADAVTRRLAGLLAGSLHIDIADGCAEVDPGALLPASSRRAYDVRACVRALLDRGEFLQVRRTWAQNVVTGLGRIGGETIGIVANNPIRRGGRLDARAAAKAMLLVRLCDEFGVPLVVLHDVPDPRVSMACHQRTLAHAITGASVRTVGVITRRSWGADAVAVSLGTTTTYAWPSAAPTDTRIIEPSSTRHHIADALSM